MKIIDFFEQNKLNLTNKKLLVAASAGPDSMALLDMLEKLQKPLKFKLIAAHFNHQLRSDSEKESQVLIEYCCQHNVALFIGKWDKNKQPNTGIEAAARNARYLFLTQIAQQQAADYLLTAHHGDDLIENILLKFIRSGNPQEMNSLQAVGKMHGVALLRPLLAYSKQELLDYDQKNKINFVLDSTNQEDEVMRNRLRHHVLPLLKKENPELINNALFFSQKITDLTNFTSKKVAEIGPVELYLGQAYRISNQKLLSLTSSEKTIFWQEIIWQKYHRRVNENMGNFTVIEYQGYFYLYQKQKVEITQPFAIAPDQPFNFKGQQFLVTTHKIKEKKSIGSFWLTADDKLMAGSLRPGQKLLLQNGQHVKAKKKFAENAVPYDLRPLCLTIYAETQPVFVEKTYQNQQWIKNGERYFVYIC